MFQRAMVLALAVGVAIPAGMASAQDVAREITNVAGDVYRFQNNNHYSLVTVTGEGVVIVDPINAEAAGWLKENLSQITDQPITHLIYSHSHLDHASGGAVFEAPNVIAQANAPEAIDGVKPTVLFDETYELTVGSKRFELTYLGIGHGEDLIVVIVRPENVAFITDVAAPKRLPFRTMASSSPDDWIAQAKRAYTLDFEIFAPAHGHIGDKADLADFIVYLETLRAEVLAGLKEGKSLEELQATIKMEDYSDWQAYDAWLGQNIQGMAGYLATTDEAR